jgi:hypothetical protein
MTFSSWKGFLAWRFPREGDSGPATSTTTTFATSPNNEKVKLEFRQIAASQCYPFAENISNLPFQATPWIISTSFEELTSGLPISKRAENRYTASVLGAKRRNLPF